MFPFASLPENLAAFCRVLNRDHGYRVGPRELRDATLALEVVPIGSERAVRNALRPVLGSTREEAEAFDAAFEAFFHRRAPGAGPGPAPEPARLAASAAAAGESRRPMEERPEEPPEAGARRDAGEVARTEPGGEGEEEAARARLRARASPLHAAGPGPAIGPVDAAWRDAARAFVRRIETGRARFWRPARRGTRFDLRRTLRGSLRTGGEVLYTQWRARPRRRPRFVVLVDGSRSMTPFVQPALTLSVALAGAAPSLDVCVFSTALERITPEVRLAVRGRRVRLPGLAAAWGGGTSIGGCLTAFARRFGDRLLAPSTVVIVVSDGLDAGAPGELVEAMARLKRLTAGIIWLNPLLATAGYQPTALGMQAARPYIDAFAWVDEPADLRSLARAVRLRR